jgi:hypothetical protein
VIQKVTDQYHGEFDLFTIRQDKLSLELVKPSQVISPLADRKIFHAYRRGRDLVSVVVMETSGIMSRPNGTLFQLSVTLPLVLEGTNEKLRRLISTFCLKEVKDLFVYRKDGRNVKEGTCAAEMIVCICVLLKDGKR